MNKKIILSLLLIALLAFGAGAGTLAYYTQTFTSQGNEIKASEFNISGEGVVGSTAFSVDKFAPGDEGMFDFKVNRNDTELPLEYIVTITSQERLPLNYTLVANNGAAQTVTSGDPITVSQNPDYGTDFFSLKYAWPWEGDDNQYKGKTEKIKIEVVAKQMQNTTVKYAAMYIRDKNTGEASQTSVRVEFTDSNLTDIQSISGGDQIFGDISLENGNLKLSNNSNYALDYKGKVNGKYQFQGFYNKEVNVEITLPE